MNIDFDKAHPAMDMAPKREFYQGFLKWSVIFTAHIIVLLLLMYIFLV